MIEGIIIILIYGLQRQSIYYDKRQSERSKLRFINMQLLNILHLILYQLKTYDFTM